MRAECRRRARVGRVALAGAALAAGLGVVACGGPGGPRNVPLPEEALHDVHGSWIQVGTDRKGKERWVVGEFLAVTADTVYVLNRQTLHAIGRDRIEEARLVEYQPQRDPILAWGAMGALSTLSHGWGLVFSMPVWLITTAITNGAANSQAIGRWPRQDWPQLVRYARFPQGPPPGLRDLQLTSPYPGARPKKESPSWSRDRGRGL